MGKNQLILTEELVGISYLEAIEKVVQIRVDRKKQYGDTYLADEDYFLLAQIENKVKRFKLQFENLEVSNDKDKKITALDSLKDLCNYSLFMIAKLERNEKY